MTKIKTNSFKGQIRVSSRKCFNQFYIHSGFAHAKTDLFNETLMKIDGSIALLYFHIREKKRYSVAC